MVCLVSGKALWKTANALRTPSRPPAKAAHGGGRVIDVARRVTGVDDVEVAAIDFRQQPADHVFVPLAGVGHALLLHGSASAAGTADRVALHAARGRAPRVESEVAAVEHGLAEPAARALDSRLHPRERQPGARRGVGEAKTLDLSQNDRVPVGRGKPFHHGREARRHFLTRVVDVFRWRVGAEPERVEVRCIAGRHLPAAPPER